jgi:hypothetical protein
MKRSALTGLTVACLIVTLLAPRIGRGSRTLGTNVRFAPVHIYLDSGDTPFAAYQFELKATSGSVKIVGVEGGQAPAFAEAPYYDPAALANDRIIIAAFSTGSDLPKGRTRIATIHLQITGDVEPEYQLNLTVAADPEGHEIPAEITLETGEDQ